MTPLIYTLHFKDHKEKYDFVNATNNIKHLTGYLKPDIVKKAVLVYYEHIKGEL